MTSIASAVTITFEGDQGVSGQQIIEENAPYVSDTFAFNPTIAGAFIADPIDAGAMRGNGSDWLGFAQGTTVTITNDFTFDLLSIDLGSAEQGDDTGTTVFNFTGYDVNGEAVATASTVGITSLEHYVFEVGGPLGDFVNLSRVEISFLTSAGDPEGQPFGAPIAGFDNVEVVPEPSAALLGGLGALALLRRRRN